MLFVALAFVSRWLIVPLSGVLGRPLDAFAGAPGMLARENVVRNPARTAVTAGALTVGIALIAFVAVLGAGLRGTINDSVRQQLRADYVISGDSAALPPAVARTLDAGPVRAVSGIRSGQARALGKTVQVSGVDPSTITRVLRLDWARGSGPGAVAQLERSGAIVSTRFADDHQLGLGSRFTIQTESGRTLALLVRGMQSPPSFGALLGAVTISTTVFDRGFTQPRDAVILADTGGVAPGSQHALTTGLAAFPAAKVRTVDAYITDSQASINTLLDLFYVLLALSVIVSLFGIVNTLALSIVERTREIGALRAMGMTRRQLTRMIRIESEITALIGATIGIVVGIALAALATQALTAWNLGFSVPWPTLAIVAVSAVLAGRLSGALPARRAARLDPLHALTYE